MATIARKESRSMALYGESTQKRCWTFTADAVRELRSSAREVVIHRVLSQLEAGSGAAAAVDGGDDRDHDVKMRHRESLDGNRCVVLEKVLTEREEMALRWTHEMRIMRICKAYNLPTVVGATAITNFKRFETWPLTLLLLVLSKCPRLPCL